MHSRKRHYERVRPVTIFPEFFYYGQENLIERQCQKLFNFIIKAMLVFLVAMPNNAWTDELAHDHMDMMPNHDHMRMKQAEIRPLEAPSQSQPLEHQSHSSVATQSIQELKDNRDPNAYTDGLDFSGLTRPKMGDEEFLGSVIVDRLEGVHAQDDFSMTYDWQAWYGQDYDKVVVRAEGEIDRGTFKNNRNEALWAHALTPFWDTQLGVRYDSGSGADRAWGAFGFQGFAPYWIYIEATAYVGEEGRTAFRLETEYDVLITQKLILQPRVELNFYSQSDPSRLVSSGLSNTEAGFRLRYEFKREFAPYIGIEWASTFGSAADLIKVQGNKPEETRFVAGVHFWF